MSGSDLTQTLPTKTRGQRKPLATTSPQPNPTPNPNPDQTSLLCCGALAQLLLNPRNLYTGYPPCAPPSAPPACAHPPPRCYDDCQDAGYGPGLVGVRLKHGAPHIHRIRSLIGVDREPPTKRGKNHSAKIRRRRTNPTLQRCIHHRRGLRIARLLLLPVLLARLVTLVHLHVRFVPSHSGGFGIVWPVPRMAAVM